MDGLRLNPVRTEAGRARSSEEHKGARRQIATNARSIGNEQRREEGELPRMQELFSVANSIMMILLTTPNSHCPNDH